MIWPMRLKSFLTLWAGVSADVPAKDTMEAGA